MTNIIRTPTRAEGGITEEEKIKMDAIAQKWTANAYQTGFCNRNKLTQAIHGLYAAANLKKPRVVIVDNPKVMALAYGISSAIWHLRKNNNKNAFDATDAATRAATFDAIRDATFDATRAATFDATRDATFDATRAATFDATRAATDAATRAATFDATRDATYAATYAATDAATRDAIRDATFDATFDAIRDATFDATDFKCYEEVILKFLKPEYLNFAKECAKKWYNVYQGGNMWSPFLAYADSMKNVINLIGLNCWDNFYHYKKAGVYGGFRVMHDEFCIVSDFPEYIKVDEQNRPHSINSPSHKWRGGFELYYIHGVKVDKRVVMNPESITVDEINSRQNLEVQRVMIDLYGREKYIADSGAIEIHRDLDQYNRPRILYKKERQNANPLLCVSVINSTPEPDGSYKNYFLWVNHECRPLYYNYETKEFSRGNPQELTCHNAVASTFGKYGHEYNPILES